MFHVDPDIRKAKTIDKSFYLSKDIWDDAKEKIFAGSWQYVGDVNSMFKADVKSCPTKFMNGYMEDPLLLIKKDEEIYCKSNVCTHRGFILSHHPSESAQITCKYHGRRFDLNGTCLHMPEFKEVEDFPSDCDHLKTIDSHIWNQFMFVSLTNQIDIQKVFATINERVGFLHTNEFTPCAQYDKIYSVHAHWALYCENYLEGFHIPFVHHDLNAMLDYGDYTTVCEEDVVTQIGYASDDTECFDLPEGHVDYGRKVAAYYFWVFPNMMLNYYPWGVQMNYIMPVNQNLTKVHFQYYLKNVNDPRFANGDKLGEKTEREDEFVVEGVQAGLKSRFYSHGRYSPTKETGVHHFHRLVAKYMNI